MAFKQAVPEAFATLLFLTMTVPITGAVPAAAAPAAAAPAAYPSDDAAARTAVEVPASAAAAHKTAASRAAVGEANDAVAPAVDRDVDAYEAVAQGEDPAVLDTLSRRKWTYRCTRYWRRHLYFLHRRLRCFSRWHKRCRWHFR